MLDQEAQHRCTTVYLVDRYRCITLSHHHTFTPSHYHTITLSHHHTITIASSHDSVTLAPHHHIATPMTIVTHVLWSYCTRVT
jgi:hypothetical protein